MLGNWASVQIIDAVFLTPEAIAMGEDVPGECKIAGPLGVLICIVSSSGGIRALEELLERLPEPLPASVVIVQHLYPTVRSHLSDILDRHTRTAVQVIEDGTPIECGNIYVASPDRHVEVGNDNRFQLSGGAQVHNVRPSGDVLLASAARNFSGRVVAIVLTGTGRDGSDGVRAVHAAGGLVIVQDPETAHSRGMPDAAVATGLADYVLSLEEIGSTVSGILKSGATA